jgi:hypothetical protein
MRIRRREQLRGAMDALELMFASVFEVDLGAGADVPHGSRDQHFGAVGLCGDARAPRRPVARTPSPTTYAIDRDGHTGKTITWAFSAMGLHTMRPITSPTGRPAASAAPASTATWVLSTPAAQLGPCARASEGVLDGFVVSAALELSGLC